MNRLVTLTHLLFISHSLASTPGSPTYEAGVVEFNYGSGRIVDPIATLESNLAKYLEIMMNAPSNLDIIVFPEMTLNQLETALEIPEIEEKVSPCENTSYVATNVLKQISCSAKMLQRYVVVNMVTKAKCPDSDMIAEKDPRKCSDRSDGFSYYNTNVVFDRSGTLISRYRKFNLFGEKVDKPFQPSMVHFDTDFGVRFGHFICFDLQFRYPALELVRNFNITDIVFTSMWYSELPFLTAVQLQQYWAFSNDVNLLAAGSNNPTIASTGTGIYAGRKGSLISVMERTNSSKLFTATVPKKGSGDNITFNEFAIRYPKSEMASLDLWRDQLEPYSMLFLEDDPMTLKVSNKVKQCHGDFCCIFDYTFERTTTQPHYRYALAVYHGKRTFSGLADGGVIVCAVIACQSDDVATCGVRNETLDFVHHWHNLQICGAIPYGQQYNFMPNTLDASIMPFGVNELSYEQITVQDDTGAFWYNISIRLTNFSRQEFYTFGIYGRDFNLDATATSHNLQYSWVLFGFITLLSTHILLP
ncbi:Vanin-like protein 1 [Pseudolycoriella hygida]|uniref:Vanin-like protein 1 n=1 Tax=Pseudolycoriella hygida TaxID=35572 RepID=A0A9Q0RVQ1_9DIPT|nr:Vanin-like protein 1 [Pseudolycoriella hygida]